MRCFIVIFIFILWVVDNNGEKGQVHIVCWFSILGRVALPYIHCHVSNRQLSTGRPAQSSVMTRRIDLGSRRESRSEEIDVYLKLTHVVVQQKLTQHCKAIILQLKENPMVNHYGKEYKKRMYIYIYIYIYMYNWITLLYNRN